MEQKFFRDNFLRNSVQTKIIMILILAATSVLAVATVFDYFMAKNRLKRDFDVVAEYIVNQQSKSLALPLWYLDTKVIEDVINSGMLEKQVYAIQVIESSGEEYGKIRDAKLYYFPKYVENHNTKYCISYCAFCQRQINRYGRKCCPD